MTFEETVAEVLGLLKERATCVERHYRTYRQPREEWAAFFWKQTSPVDDCQGVFADAPEELIAKLKEHLENEQRLVQDAILESERDRRADLRSAGETDDRGQPYN
jgi:hypothetical protein